MALFSLILIGLLLAAILSKKMSPIVAFIAIPTIGAVTAALYSTLFLGVSKSPWEVSKYIVDGIKTVSPTAAMFIFAIIFFGLMNDVGIFDPIVNFILKIIGTNPVAIVMGSAFLAMAVHLDGAGAVTFLVTVPPMIGLYDRLGLQRKILAAVVGLGAGVMNIVPWGGPTIRAIAALESDVATFFNPILPVMLTGLCFVLLVAFFLGKKEAKRIGYVKDKVEITHSFKKEFTPEELALKRPKLLLFNAALTLTAIVILISGKLAPAVVMMFATSIALFINFPKVSDQKARIDAHAKTALLMGSILFAAGAFMGIMKGAGFTGAMTASIVKHMPQEFATHIPFITGILSMPLSLIFDPDSFYYGILPVVSEAVETMGGSRLMVGQAAVLGQMTTGFPVSPLTPSTFLLVGLCGIELSDHQKFAIPLAFLTTVVMVFAAVFFGIFPL